MFNIINNSFSRHSQINQLSPRIGITNLMCGFRSSGTTNNNISHTKGSWNRILSINYLSLSLENVEYFFSRIMIVIRERSFTGWDFDKRHTELLSTQRSRD